MDADAAAGRQAAHVPSRLACLCLLDVASFCAFVLPEPLQTPGRSVHAQRPRQKLQDAMSTHIRHDAAAGTIAKHFLRLLATIPLVRRLPTQHLPIASATFDRISSTAAPNFAPSTGTASQNVGGKSGAPLIGQCHYLPLPWVGDALSVVVPKEHVTSAARLLFRHEELAVFEQGVSCHGCDVWRTKEFGSWAFGRGETCCRGSVVTGVWC